MKNLAFLKSFHLKTNVGGLINLLKVGDFLYGTLDNPVMCTENKSTISEKKLFERTIIQRFSLLHSISISSVAVVIV